MAISPFLLRLYVIIQQILSIGSRPVITSMLYLTAPLLRAKGFTE